MKDMRMFGSLEEAVAARERLDQSDSKASAEVIAPGDSDARARLEQAKLSEQDIVGGLAHLEAGRALLIIDTGMLDMLRMNDLLGPNNAAESKAWTPGVGNLEDNRTDDLGGRRDTPERSGL